MPKENSREAKYRTMLQALGVWQEAFAPAVHSMCILEREISRTRTAWSRTTPRGVAPSPMDPLYTLIRQQERDLLAYRDALGLTPKGLRRLKAASIVPESAGTEATQGASPAVTALLDNLRAQAAANANVSNMDTSSQAADLSPRPQAAGLDPSAAPPSRMRPAALCSPADPSEAVSP